MYQKTVRAIIANTRLHRGIPSKVRGRQALDTVRGFALHWISKAPLSINEHLSIHSINTSHLLLVAVAPLRQERHSEHPNARVYSGLQ